MKTTESEAVKKWCPNGRVGWMHETPENGVGGMTYNRDHEGNGDAHSLCLGSACMAWRWLPALSVAPEFEGGSPVQSVARKQGFCGLAGKP